MPAPPPLDSRSYDQLVAYLSNRIQADTGWKPPADGSQDVGSTLVQIFARMMEQVRTRLNQVPELHYRAYLDLLGTQRLPPAAARVPLTFLPSAGSQAEPTVPAQTAVAAPAEGAQPEAAFYTEADLVLSQAQLVHAYTRQPAADGYQDVTAPATGVIAAPFAAFGGADCKPVEHALFIACDALLARSDLAQLTLTLELVPTADPQAYAGLVFSYWDGQRAQPLAMTPTITASRIEWKLSPVPPMASIAAGGQSAVWLRAPLKSAAASAPLLHIGATASLKAAALVPTAAWANSAAVDLGRDFLPLGSSPLLQDAFYLCGGEESVQQDVLVTLHATISDTLWGAGASTLTGTPELRLSWEVKTSSGWTTLPPASVTDGTANLTFAGAGSPTQDIQFKLPPGVAVPSVKGQPWLRARLASGAYGVPASGLDKPRASQPSPIPADFTKDYGYVVMAISAAGAIQLGDPLAAKGPDQPTVSKYIAISWQAVAGAASYAVFRTSGAASGFIGTTTGTLFADAGQPPGPPPAVAQGPARPCLKALTMEFAGVTLGSDAATRPISVRSRNDGSWRSWTAMSVPFTPFVPVADDRPALYLGFDRPFSNQQVALFLQLDPPTAQEVAAAADAGVPAGQPSTGDGVAAAPVILWEYYSATRGFTPLSVQDDTDTLIRSGAIELIGPTDFASSTCFGKQGYWLRARLYGDLQPERRLRRILTNTTWAVQARTMTAEVLGSSDGSADQSFQLSQVPVLGGERIEVREPQPPPDELLALAAQVDGPVVTTVPATASSAAETWVRWLAVPDFRGSGPLDRHYVIDRITGQVCFGNGRSGRIPLAGGQNLRAASYQTGGGAAGNRPAGKVVQLRSSITYVDGAVNYGEAAGGTDAEDLSRWKLRSASCIRHGARAVTVQDFEDLALAASPSIARARALGATLDLNNNVVLRKGRVLVLILPNSTAEPPVPGLELLQTVRAFLAARSSPSVAVQVAGPSFSQVKVKATLVPKSINVADQLLHAAQAALRAFLHPLTGNLDGSGWGFGRTPHNSDLYRALAAIPTLDSVPALALVCDPPPDSRSIIYPGTIELTLSSPGGSP